MAFVLLVFSLMLAAAESPRLSFLPLTGIPGYPSGRDFGDPSSPDLSEKNYVRVYTTGGDVLSWRSNKSQSALAQFLHGEPPALSRLKVFHSDGKTEFDDIGAGEDVWDPTIEVIDGKRILFAGAMAPKPGEVIARWPEDHWSRRTYAFDLKDSRWVQRKKSVFGNSPTASTWIGHNYGHHFIRDEGDKLWMFYEKVTEEENGHPIKTELFARRLNKNQELFGEEFPILKIPKKPWPASVREDGTLLVEGARPFKVGNKYFVSFSAGDYFSSQYGIHLLSANRITGPYRPYLSNNGDLKNFGREIEKELPLTWGAARGAFFEADGKWWVLFHGVPMTQNESMESRRQIYLAPAFFTSEPHIGNR